MDQPIVNTDVEFADGTTRKLQYGKGKHPWDEIKELGWGAEFAAGNILKYLKRIKDPKHDLESARRYHEWLVLLMPSEDQNNPEARRLRKIYSDLRIRLTPAQRELLGGM